MKNITIKDIAKKAGLSHQSVSEVLNNYEKSRISQATRERVLKITQDLNYQPNHFAQSLKSGRTNLIGVTIPGGAVTQFDEPYPAKIYKGIGDSFSHGDYKLIFQHFQEIAQPGHYLELAKSRTVDGLIMVLFSLQVEAFKEKELGKIRETGIPFVVIHSLLYDLQCPVVGLDCIKGGALVAEHLVGHGYGSMGIVYNPSILHQIDLFTGYTQALERHGRSIDSQFIYPFAGFWRDESYQLADRLIAEKRPLPRALFVAEDISADGIIKRFTEAGIRIPQDVAIIGFGDLDEGICYYSGLTSLKQPAMEKGQAAGELLLKLIECPAEREKAQRIFLEPTLTIRTTCGCKQNTAGSEIKGANGELRLTN